MCAATRDVCYGPEVDILPLKFTRRFTPPKVDICPRRVRLSLDIHRRDNNLIGFLLGGHVSARLDYGPIVYENEPADHVCSTSAG